MVETRFAGFALIAALLVLWEISARYWSDSPSWPPLSQVCAALVNGARTGELTQVFGSSLVRMFTGYAAGTIAGVALGLLMASSRWWQALLEPSVELLRPIPIPAIVPPLILILGIDNSMKIFVVAFSSFFPVVINTLQGAKAVEPTLLATARTFGISRLRTLTRIVLPASLPYVFAGMRVSLALALIVTVVAEMIAGSEGIGFYLISMQYAMRPADMYAGVLLVAGAGYGLNGLLLLIEKTWLPWYHQQGAQ
jgi:ABC-type nitrate/sulfonate/bicarbonate transport system permease component